MELCFEFLWEPCILTFLSNNFIFFSVQMNYILSWSKQGSVMPSKAIEQNGVLLIPDLKRSDQGNYVCMGTDMFSEDSASVILIVEEGIFKLYSPIFRFNPFNLFYMGDSFQD